ncbi:hypothetical protein F511_16605 [Dorcoceras hygrometricum]|uniref:Uncharacterized protein n=1 Tax=Dorcoceras hygrometricum TaxID=472368 RepID=A0A2Z7CHS8_9LAMI|nr:hypothetical protein F511_16605 [Dorcoceras hygrometricum]
MPPIIASGPEDRAARTRCRTTPIAREDDPRTYPNSGVYLEEKIMPPRVQPVYASPSLNYEITENSGENLAQDTHQSRRNLRRDKCPSTTRQAKSPGKSLISTA